MDAVLEALMRFEKLEFVSIGPSVPLLLSRALEPWNARERAWMVRVLMGDKGVRIEFEVESNRECCSCVAG